MSSSGLCVFFRKIFRKPVYGDSIDEFAQLLATVKRSGSHQYVAFCNLAVARAEQSLKNYNKEASNLVDAGTIFWDLEQQERTSMAVAGFEEYATEAINCYLLAIKIHIEQKRHSLACTLFFEMAQALKVSFSSIYVWYYSITLIQKYGMGSQ